MATKDFSKAGLFGNKQDAAAAPPAPPAAAAPAAPAVPDAPPAATPPTAGAPADATPVADAKPATPPAAAAKPEPPVVLGPDGKPLPNPIAEDVPVMNPDYQYCTAFKVEDEQREGGKRERGVGRRAIETGSECV